MELLKSENITVKVKQGSLPIFNRIEIWKKVGNDTLYMAIPFISSQETKYGNIYTITLAGC